jgi:hypothetical protein
VLPVVSFRSDSFCAACCGGVDSLARRPSVDGAVDAARIVATFLRHMEHGGHKVSRAEFEQNIEAKLRDEQFSNDIGPLLAPGFEWDTALAAARVRS